MEPLHRNNQQYVKITQKPARAYRLFKNMKKQYDANKARNLHKKVRERKNNAHLHEVFD